jgi:hypothetical protein
MSQRRKLATEALLPSAKLQQNAQKEELTGQVVAFQLSVVDPSLNLTKKCHLYMYFKQMVIQTGVW